MVANSPEELCIRDVCAADFESIAQIRNQSIRIGDAALAADEQTGEALMAEWRAMSVREPWLVAERNGQILGYCLLKAYSPRLGYRCTGETSTFIRRDCLRQGLGRRLKLALIERCRSLGYRHIVAKVLAENQGSLGHNYAVGFELVGVQKQIGYRNGRWLDVAIMQLILEDVPPYKPELG